MTRPHGLLYATAGARELAVLRITVFALWLPHLVVWPIRNLANVPDELVVPRGVFRLVPLEALAASPVALVVLQVVAVLGAIACLLGSPGYRWIGVPTVTALLLHEGLVRSIGGFTNHGRLAMLLLAIGLVATPAADALSLRRARAADDGRHAWALVAMAAVVTSTYSLVAARRLITGGAGMFTSRSMELWMVARSTQQSMLDHDLGRMLIDHPLLVRLLPLLFLVTTVAELVAPLVLRFDLLRRVWLPVVIGFHISVTVTMNIDFRLHTVLVVVLFWLIPLLAARRTVTGADRQRRSSAISRAGRPHT